MNPDPNNPIDPNNLIPSMDLVSDSSIHRHRQVSPHMARAVQDVVTERVAQDKMWGQQNHEPGKWLLILMEEVGEWSQAVLDHGSKGAPKEHIREELVQVAAVALSMLECLDRNDKDPTS